MINATNLLQRSGSVRVTGSFTNPDIVESLQKINSNLSSAKYLIEKTNENEKKRVESERKKTETDKRKEEEKKKENVKKQTKLLSLTAPTLSKGSFLEGIKNFLLYTILGYGALKLMKHLPKILEVSKGLIPIAETAEKTIGMLFNAVVSGIDNGYKAYDKLRALSKSIGGEDYQKTFDDFSGKLNTFVNAAILVGLAVAGAGVLGSKGKPSGKLPMGPTRRPMGAAGATPRLSPSGVTQGGAGVNRGPLNRGPRVTQSSRGPNLNPLRSAPAVTEGMGDVLASRAGRKAFLGTVRNVTSKIKAPVIGGLIDFAILWALGEDPGRAAFRAIGSTLLGSVGAALAGAAGIVSGPGAIAAAILGGMAGGVAGDYVGGALYDLFFNGKTASSKTVKINGVEKKASGGVVGSKKAPSRTIRRAPKSPTKYQPKKSNPGASIGGQKEIEKLFPNPKESDVKSPGRSLTSSSSKLKKIPLLGGVMGASIDVAQGQQIDKTVFKNFSKNLGLLVDNLVNEQVAMNTSDIQRSIYAMADGGVVPSTRTLNVGRSVGERFADAMNKTIEIASRSRVEEVLRDLRKELMLKDPAGSGGIFNAEGVPGGVSVNSDSEDFWLLATAALFENSDPQGAADVAQAIYNRVAMPGDPWHTGGSIRKTILNPSQFAPVDQYGGASVWNTIKDKQSAISFVKKYGRSQEQLESIASALLDTTRQRSARTFVGPRDSFRSVSYEKANNHLANDTEVTRAGHVFGFEPRGATIGAFRAGKLTAAEINKSVSGEVQYLVGSKGEIFPLPKGNPQFNTTEGYMGGTFTSTRSGGRQHKGQDIGVDPGSPVLAMKSGIVEAIYRDYGGVGDAVVIRYADGQTGIYGHVNPTVGINAKIKAGQKIATIFNEGSNSHLHYMRRLANGNYVNPLPILKNLKSSSKIVNKPNKPQTLTPQAKVIRSVDLGLGNVVTEREGGKFTLKGNPISKEELKKLKENHPNALKDFNVSSTFPSASFTPVASAIPSIKQVSSPSAAKIAYNTNTRQDLLILPVVNTVTAMVSAPQKSPSISFTV